MQELAFEASPLYAWRMKETTLAMNIAALRRHLGDNQEKFAQRVGVQQSYVSKWENKGIIPSTEPLLAMARLAGRELDAFVNEPWDPKHIASAPLSDHSPTLKSEEGSIPLRHLDMSLSMGDGANIDDYFEEGVFEFDAQLLRTISRAPTHRLIVGHGIGDSMQPTLHDRDMVIFDTTQTNLSVTDKIWAISLFGAGAIKRLRTVAKDRVLVISDNPTLENQEVSTEDLRILGRVIWSARTH